MERRLKQVGALAQLRAHYLSRSFDELQEKIYRGRADTGTHYDLQEMIRRNLLFDQIEDLDILPLAKRVEAEMKAQSPPDKI